MSGEGDEAVFVFDPSDSFKEASGEPEPALRERKLGLCGGDRRDRAYI